MTVPNIKPVILAPEIHFPRPLRERYIDTKGYMDFVLKLLTKGTEIHDYPQQALIMGPHGIGKSLFIGTVRELLSERMGFEIPMEVCKCSEDTREYHLSGTHCGVGDYTPFVLGKISGAIDIANREAMCILNLEEISALPPGSQKELNGVLDWQKSLAIPEIRSHYSLRNGAKLIILASMNPIAYGGVFALNADLKSRFHQKILLSFPSETQEQDILQKLCPNGDEDIIEKLCKLATQARTSEFTYKLSTRDLRNCVDGILLTDDPHRCLMSIANNYEGSERDTIADRIDAIFKADYPVSVLDEVKATAHGVSA